MKPIRIINSVAPIRICDFGGWTDTWFAEYGTILNIGVYPYAEVQVEVYRRQDKADRISVFAENFGDRYVVHPENLNYDRHPLLEAAFKCMSIPDDIAIQVSIYSEAPAGGSTGTSASVSVALIGALDCLTKGRLTAHEVARTAQEIETKMLHQQCGIQDQICSAYGGINFIEMTKYPNATVSPLQIPNSTWWELERRLALIYVGKSHSSTQVHGQVIKGLENAGPEAPQLKPLRETPRLAKDALFQADFEAFGEAMIANTIAQGELHPALISPEAWQIIEIAKKHGALGYKVNGAGGDGGSLTLLAGPDMAQKRAMIQAIEKSSPLFRNIPVYLSRQGLRVWG